MNLDPPTITMLVGVATLGGIVWRMSATSAQLRLTLDSLGRVSASASTRSRRSSSASIRLNDFNRDSHVNFASNSTARSGRRCANPDQERNRNET
jgi:hypothetical protein